MSGVERRGRPPLAMAVDMPGTKGSARDAILRLVPPLRGFAGEPIMDARSKKTDSWILGFGSHCFLEPTAQD